MPRRPQIRSLLAFTGLLLAACPGPKTVEAPRPAAPAPIEATLVIRGVHVFDGEARVGPTSVAVAGDAIVAVGPDLAVTGGAAEIDGAGMTLLPGLIDAHTHIQSADQLRQALEFGVTTELDMFSLPSFTGPLRKIAGGRAGRSLADFRSAGILATAPGGHGTEYGMAIPTLTGPDQAAAFVDARLAEGSDYVKIVLDDGHAFDRALPTLAPDTVRALIAAAHARGKLAVVHVSSQREAVAAVEAGADGLVHVFFDTPPDDAFLRLAVSRKIFVADTLAVLMGLCDRSRGAALADDPALQPMIGPGDRRALTIRAGAQLPASACAHALAAVGALHRAGVPLLASTDAPNPGTLHGASLHDELALLIRAGLSPAAALAAATSVPADIFGLPDRGRIAAGKRADLLLVRGDPTRDITATRAIVGVWKAGARLDRDAYRDAVRQEYAAIATLRAAPPPPGAESGQISDFEAGERVAAFGAGWQPATDELIGGTSTVALTPARKGARRSKGALRIAGTVVASAAPATWSGAMFFPGAAPMQPANLGKFTKIALSARGDRPGKLSVLVFASQLGPVPARRELDVTTAWSDHGVTFAELGLEAYDITGVFFGATSPGAFALEIDDVRLE